MHLRIRTDVRRAQRSYWGQYSSTAPRHLAPSGSPSNANPSIPNGYRPSGLPHLPRRRQPNPTEPLDAR